MKKEFFWDNGNLKSEVLIINGKKNGVEKHYFKDGFINKEISFTSGVQDGQYVEYYNPTRYNNYNYSSGVKLLGNFNNDKKSGIFVKYKYVNGGIIISHKEYKAGVLNGCAIELKYYYKEFIHDLSLAENEIDEGSNEENNLIYFQELVLKVKSIYNEIDEDYEKIKIICEKLKNLAVLVIHIKNYHCNKKNGYQLEFKDKVGFPYSSFIEKKIYKFEFKDRILGSQVDFLDFDFWYNNVNIFKYNKNKKVYSLECGQTLGDISFVKTEFFKRQKVIKKHIPNSNPIQFKLIERFDYFGKNIRHFIWNLKGDLMGFYYQYESIIYNRFYHDNGRVFQENIMLNNRIKDNKTYWDIKIFKEFDIEGNLIIEKINTPQILDIDRDWKLGVIAVEEIHFPDDEWEILRRFGINEKDKMCFIDSLLNSKM